VLGVVQACGEYLSSFLRYGRSNDSTQVEKLQLFLNEHMQSGLPVTGFFGRLTESAVKKFQVMYYNDVLKPWKSFNLLPNEESGGTGYVYKTTKWKINMLKCSDLNLTLPELP
jgi:hypothetical protein